MHEHRTAGGAPTSVPPNPPPTLGSVHGLGVVDALRVDLERTQLPWLAAAIDDVYASVEQHLSNERASYRGLAKHERERRGPRALEIEQEMDRRAYQLRVLEMIRGQLSTGLEPAGAALGAGSSEPRVVVGPAPLMTELLRRATESVAKELRDALHDEPHGTDTGAARLTSPAAALARAAHLRTVTAATHAYAATLVHLLDVLTYNFDPDYSPVRDDELDPR